MPLSANSKDKSTKAIEPIMPKNVTCHDRFLGAMIAGKTIEAVKIAERLIESWDSALNLCLDLSISYYEKLFLELSTRTLCQVVEIAFWLI